MRGNILMDSAATMLALVHTKELFGKMYDVKAANGKLVMMNNNPEKVVATGKLDISVRCAKTNKVTLMRLDDVMYVPTSKYFILGWSAYSSRLESKTRRPAEGKLTSGMQGWPLEDGSLVWGKRHNGLFYLDLCDDSAVCMADLVEQQAEELPVEQQPVAQSVGQNSVSIVENKGQFQPSPLPSPSPAEVVAAMTIATAKKRLLRLHRCCGHTAFSSLQALIKSGKVQIGDSMVRKQALLLTDADLKCPHCGMAKTRKHHPKPSGAPAPFRGQWTMDAAGPNPRSKAGNAYKIVVVAPNDKGVFQHFCKRKRAAQDAIVVQRRRWENMTGERMLALRTDRGPEMTGKKFRRCLDKKGILHTKTAPGSSVGAAESYIGKIQDLGRANLEQAVDLPSALYWDEAENAAAHTIDIMPKAKLGMSMYEHRTGRKPDYSREYPFGAIAAVRMTGNVKRGDNPGVKALHLGPAANGDAGRRFLRLATGTVITSNSFWIDSDCFSWTHAAAQDGVRALKEMGRELPREEDRMATGLRQQREQHIPVPDAMEGKAHEQQQVQAPVEAKAYEQQQDPVEVAPEEEPAEEPAGRPARARQAREPRFDPTLLDLAFK
jgi:hypothetical protein